MNNLFTIGFTQKNAETFFNLLSDNHVEIVIDIRLNNISQLAGFSKYPDIKFFLNKICNINYLHDEKFTPEECTLKRYKKDEIDWNKYVEEFNNTMKLRKIDEYIKSKYKDMNNICLLCSEPTDDKCHRRLIADKFKEQFHNLIIINL